MMVLSRRPSLPPAGRRLRALALAAALAAAGAAPLSAKIDLVTLPERGETELTIYNSEDLTLVRERRTMSFGAGRNPLQFSWANTLIDPTSVHLEVVEGGDFLEVEDISYPANTANTLIWWLDASRGGEGTIEITYFTSGITWAADYVVVSDGPEKELSLDGYVRVTNGSGEDYLAAKTRLIVGEINLVQDIAELGRLGLDYEEDRRSQVKNEMMLRSREVMMADAMPEGAAFAGGAIAQAKEVSKEGVSEYFLFTIEGREDLEDGLSKRLPSFDESGVPFRLTYRHNPYRWGSGVTKFYLLKNDEESELGDSPLPDGYYTVFREAAQGGGLAYLGRHAERYIPVGEDLEINLGSDGLIVLEDRRTSFRRVRLSYGSNGDVNGWDTEEEWEVVVRNSKREAVPLEVTRRFGGDFDFEAGREQPGGGSWTKKSAEEYELKATLGAMSESRFRYTVTTRTGANAKR